MVVNFNSNYRQILSTDIHHVTESDVFRFKLKFSDILFDPAYEFQLSLLVQEDVFRWRIIWDSLDQHVPDDNGQFSCRGTYGRCPRLSSYGHYMSKPQSISKSAPVDLSQHRIHVGFPICIGTGCTDHTNAS